MRYKELSELNREIQATREPGDRGRYAPVINMLSPTQRILIISSDPSLDTDKSGETLAKHSDFEERVIALFFLGRDGDDEVRAIREKYATYKKSFLDRCYWTHFSKTYSAGHPGRFWADRFLRKEIELFEPEVIVVFGGVVADFLLGRAPLRSRVNRELRWNRIPVICTLHPSKDWNLRRPAEFDFYPTWSLIRSVCALQLQDHSI